MRVDLSFKGKDVSSEMKLRVYSLGAQWALSSYTSRLAQEMETYAKNNHPWTNRTGRAERGLNAKIDSTTSGWRQTVVLSHGSDVWYGYHLEQSMGKRFAIIEPTMRVFEPRVKNELGSIFGNVKMQ